MENINCNNCTKEFNNTSRKPCCLINCLHTFCSECIQILDKTTSKTCPECQQQFEKTNINWELLKLIDYEPNNDEKNETEEDLKLTCNICFDEYNQLDKKPYMLLDCMHTFCQSCIKTFKVKDCPNCKNHFHTSKSNLKLIEIINKLHTTNLNRLKNELNELDTLIKRFNPNEIAKTLDNSFKQIKMQIVKHGDDLVKLINLNKIRLLDLIKRVEAKNREIILTTTVDKSWIQSQIKLDMNSLKKAFIEIETANAELKYKTDILSDIYSTRYEFKHNENSLQIKSDFFGKISRLNQSQQEDKNKNENKLNMSDNFNELTELNKAMLTDKIQLPKDLNAYKMKKSIDNSNAENEWYIRVIGNYKDEGVKHNKEKMESLRENVKLISNQLAELVIKIQKDLCNELKQLEANFIHNLSVDARNEQAKFQNEFNLFKSKLGSLRTNNAMNCFNLIRQNCLISLQGLTTTGIEFISNKKSFKMSTDFIGVVNRHLLPAIKEEDVAKMEKKIEFAYEDEAKHPLDYYLTNGSVLVSQKEYRDAIDWYNEAIKLYPRNYEPLTENAFCCIHLDEFEIALKLLNKSHQLNSSQVKVWNGKGIALMYLNKPGKALEWFDKVVSSNEKHLYLDAFANRCKLLQIDLFRSNEALDCINEALRINPKHLKCIEAKVEVLCLFGDFEEAIKLVDSSFKYAESEDDLFILYSVNSHIMKQMGEKDKAIYYLDVASNECPSKRDYIKELRRLLENQSKMIHYNKLNRIN